MLRNCKLLHLLIANAALSQCEAWCLPQHRFTSGLKPHQQQSKLASAEIHMNDSLISTLRGLPPISCYFLPVTMEMHQSANEVAVA